MILSDAEQIEMYRLQSLKQGLKLEIVGIKISSKVNCNKFICTMLGLPVRTKRENTLIALQAYIDNFKANSTFYN